MANRCTAVEPLGPTVLSVMTQPSTPTEMYELRLVELPTCELRWLGPRCIQHLRRLALPTRGCEKKSNLRSYSTVLKPNAMLVLNAEAKALAAHLLQSYLF